MAPDTLTHRAPVTDEELTTVMSGELYTPDTLGMLAHRVHLLRGLPCGANDPRVTEHNTRKALTDMIAAGTVVFAKGSPIPTREDPAVLIGARHVRRGVTYYALAERAAAFRLARARAEEARAHADGLRTAARALLASALADGDYSVITVDMPREQVEMLLGLLS